jgi:hypothetical protein
MSKRILHVTLHADNPQFDEREVTKLIDKAPDWVHYAPDCWLPFTSLSPGTWYKRLQTIIGENDELLVTPVSWTSVRDTSASLCGTGYRNTPRKNMPREWAAATFDNKLPRCRVLHAPAACAIAQKSSARRLAPPTSAPSTSGNARILPAFAGLTEPP